MVILIYGANSRPAWAIENQVSLGYRKPYSKRQTAEVKVINIKQHFDCSGVWEWHIALR